MVAAALGACGGQMDDGASSSDELGAKAAKPPQLNLSHIACTPEGTVLAHFVLLFSGAEQPGPLTGTYNGGIPFGPVDATKNTGNVWHYNVILPAGEIEIESASATTSDGVVVALHNPGEYSGTYLCEGDTDEVCSVAVTPGVYCLLTVAMGDPGDECGNFGLLVQGKDTIVSGTTDLADEDAYVAIVKSGRGECPQHYSAYNVYVGVSAGDVLETPYDQGISHVTYCACPDPQ